MKNIFTVFALVIFLISTVAAQSTKVQFKKTPSGLEYAIIKKGKGEKVQSGLRVYVNFTTRIKPDTIFDTNTGKGGAYSFILGQEEVLKGWEEAILLLSVGDSAHFRIPPALAYGEKKLGSIPANTTLLLEIRIVKVEQAFYNHLGKDTITFPSGLKKIPVIGGSGEMIKPFNLVTMKFTGYVINKKGYKRVFQSSLTNSNLAVFQLGSGRMVKGLDEGISTMRIGEKSTFIVPPSLGFGDKASGVIPANSTLYFDMEPIASNDPFWHPTNTDTMKVKNGIKILPVLSKEGSNLKSSDIVTFDCIGYFIDTLGHPIIFDNTFERKKPSTFRVGSAGVLPGLKEAFLHLKNGEQAIVFIPAKMGFGNKRSGMIPPNTSIIFQINIINAKPYPFSDTNGLDTVKYSSGLKSIFVKTGVGAVADSGDYVSVAYTGFTIDSAGTYSVFDASRESGKMMEFILGKKKVIPGFDEGIKGMNVGEGRRLIIPYALGYGEKGIPAAGILPKATIYFDVELFGIKKFESIEPKDNKTQIK